jgi:hypothetical protein
MTVKTAADHVPNIRKDFHLSPSLCDGAEPHLPKQYRVHQQCLAIIIEFGRAGYVGEEILSFERFGRKLTARVFFSINTGDLARDTLAGVWRNFCYKVDY